MQIILPTCWGNKDFTPQNHNMHINFNQNSNCSSLGHIVPFSCNPIVLYETSTLTTHECCFMNFLSY